MWARFALERQRTDEVKPRYPLWDISARSDLQLTKTESLLKYVGATEDVLKNTKFAGRILGGVGALLTVREDFKENKQGWGTAAKFGIGVATTVAYGAFAPWALGYTIIDVGVGVATGTTVTDRIAAGIDNVTKN